MEKKTWKNIVVVLFGSLFFYLIGLVVFVRFFDASIIAEREEKIILGYDENQQRFILNEPIHFVSKQKKN